MFDTEESLWESTSARHHVTTSVQNLIRYRPSGTYFARFKVGGLLRGETRLPDKMCEYRSRYESVAAFANGKMTVGDAAEGYL